MAVMHEEQKYRSGQDLAGRTGRAKDQIKLGLTKTTINARQLNRGLVGINH